MVMVFVTKFCPTLCDPRDCSPPGFSVHEVSQARILEWVAISFFRGSSQSKDQTHISCTDRWILAAEPPGKPISLSSIFRVFWLFLFMFITISTSKSAYLISNKVLY